jgi:hypothetical protein
MKITKYELEELNKKKKVEIWVNYPKGAEHYETIEVKE